MTRLTADGTPVTPDMLAKYIMSYLLNVNATTNTEGMIESDIFPVNYFPIRQVRDVPTILWSARVFFLASLHYCRLLGCCTTISACVSCGRGRYLLLFVPVLKLDRLLLLGHACDPLVGVAFLP